MHDEDHLNEFEQRLSNWRPTTEGLESDAMLYQAGLQAGRQRRDPNHWVALCLLLAVCCACLGAWGMAERTMHQSLAESIHNHPLIAADTASSPVVIPAYYVPSSNDYYQLRRLTEQDPGQWFVSLPTTPIQPSTQPVNPDIPRAGQMDRFRDQ